MADNSRPPVIGYPAPPRSAYSNGHPPGPYSNTAYPYAAPRPQYVSYQYYAPDQRATFLRYFLAVMIAFCAIIGGMLLIVWLVLQPRLPEFRDADAPPSLLPAHRHLRRHMLS